MFFKRTAATGALLLCFCSPVFALQIPDADGYVVDAADILSDQQEASLEARIANIETSTTAEIGILTLPSTDGEDIATVAFDTGNAWGVGKKENDNGLVIVVATEDRDWFMATGYGLEGSLPDAIVKRMGENDFPPYFRNGDYYGGLLAALNDAEAYIQKDPDVIALYEEEPVYDFESDYTDEVWDAGLFTALIFVAFGKSMWIGLSKKRIRNAIIANVILFAVGILFLSIEFVLILMAMSVFIDIIAIISGSSGSSGGGSGGSTSSSWSSGSSSNSSSWGSSDSSSGGSFGGGSFGGGGAGGKW